MKKTITIILNLFVGIMSLGAWIFMTLFTEGFATLASGGFSSLKYFTVLSNLFNGAVSLLYACWMIRGREITAAKKTLKLVASAAVGLTFLTIMAFLGPIYGYGMMFNGANFWFHLVLPVMSLLGFVFLEQGCRIPFRNTLYAALPPFLYSIGYVLNIIINGKGTWPDTNDFYGFLNWGNAVGAVIAFSIVLVTWGIGLILYRAGKVYIKKR